MASVESRIYYIRGLQRERRRLTDYTHFEGSGNHGSKKCFFHNRGWEGSQHYGKFHKINVLFLLKPSLSYHCFHWSMQQYQMTFSIVPWNAFSPEALLQFCLLGMIEENIVHWEDATCKCLVVVFSCLQCLNDLHGIL